MISFYLLQINVLQITLTISSCYRTVPNAIWGIFSEFLIFLNLFIAK